MKNTVKSTLIASTVAALFSACAHSSAAAPAGHDDKMASAVHCAGVNQCKGQSECKTATNGCKAQNSCKGQGWVSTATEKDCTDQGGKVLAAM